MRMVSATTSERSRKSVAANRSARTVAVVPSMQSADTPPTMVAGKAPRTTSLMSHDQTSRSQPAKCVTTPPENPSSALLSATSSKCRTVANRRTLRRHRARSPAGGPAGPPVSSIRRYGAVQIRRSVPFVPLPTAARAGNAWGSWMTRATISSSCVVCRSTT